MKKNTKASKTVVTKANYDLSRWHAIQAAKSHLPKSVILYFESKKNLL